MNTVNKVNEYLLNNFDKIKINSNEILRGDVFIALQGSNFHGNKYIKNSIKKGAKFCITDKKRLNQFTEKEINKVILVDDIYSFLLKIAKIKRSLYNGIVLGITGSAGKTSLKETLCFFLKKTYKISASKKSYNNFLGVLITLLNLNLKSKFAIFEIGTSNFGEIRKLTSIVKPSHVFITNIQSTHLLYFKNKKNIASEKSDIFNVKYNSNAKFLYLYDSNPEEHNIYKLAVKQKIKKIILFGNSSSRYFINSVKKQKNYCILELSVNNKIYKTKIDERLYKNTNNILFTIAFFDENNLNINIVIKNSKNLLPVSGRGLSHNLKINNQTIKFIDESYNANPDTMRQSIDYFNNLESKSYSKIIILGNMNELGRSTQKFHLQIMKILENCHFDKVILCGDFFKNALNKLRNPNHRYVYKQKSNQILDYIKKNVHKKAIIMAKCSNFTEVNIFVSKLLK